MPVRVPRVELLWWAGCPSWTRAEAELRDAMRAAGLDSARLVLREVPTTEAAGGEGFVGSPTVRIDGADLQAPDPPVPAGLTCRMYRQRDGRLRPTPDPADLRDALTQAAGDVS